MRTLIALAVLAAGLMAAPPYEPMPPYMAPWRVTGGTITPDTVHAAKGVFDTLEVVDAFYLDYEGAGIAIKATASAKVTTLNCAAGSIPTYSGSGSSSWTAGAFSTTAAGMAASSAVYQRFAPPSTFTQPVFPSNNTMTAGTFGLSKYIIVGGMDSDSLDGILTSSDGTTWTDVKGISGSAFYTIVACNTTTCLIGGNSSALISTTNLTSFTSQTFGGASVGIRGLAWSPTLSLWVAATTAGTIRTSPDGVTWTARTSGVATVLRWATWSTTNSLFVVVGDGGVILTSPDGINWTPQTSGTGVTLYGIYEGGGTLVAFGDSLKVLTSTNGTSWTTRSVGTTSNQDFYIGGYTASTYIIAGENGRVFTSSDAVTWTQVGVVQPGCLTPRYWDADSARIRLGWTGMDSVFTMKFLRVTDSARTPILRTDTIFTGRLRATDTVSSAMGVRSANYNAGGLTATFGGAIVPGISASAAGSIFRGNTNGLNLRGITGSVNDVAIRNAADSIIISNPTGSRTVLVGVNATGGAGSYIGFGLSNGTPINQNAGNLFEIENNTALQFTMVGSSAQLTGYARGGTKASPTAAPGDGNLLSLAGRGYNGSAYTTASSGFFSIRADGLWSGSNTGTYFTWFGTPNGSTTMAEWMRLFASNLGIGTTVSGSGALKTLVLSNSATGPSSSTDLAHLYARDVSAGNAALAIYAEAAEVAGTGSGTDQLIPVYYNGAVRYILTKSAP